MKISELKRVVNVDVISKYASILSDVNNKDEKQIERILNELGKKTPSREILMRTRLGFILKDLTHRETLPKRLRDMARDLRNKWKEFHKRLLLAPKYDVKCDKPTSENRQRARLTLTNTLVRLSDSQTDEVNTLFDPENEANKQLISDIEFAIFQHCDHLVNAKYFCSVRKCIRVLTENKALRGKLLNFDLNVNQFVLENGLKQETDVSASDFRNFFDPVFRDSNEPTASGNLNLD